MLTKRLADFLNAATRSEDFEVVGASANRFALCDDDAGWRADNYLLAGMARLLLGIIAFALPFVLGLTLLLFDTVNDEVSSG